MIQAGFSTITICNRLGLPSLRMVPYIRRLRFTSNNSRTVTWKATIHPGYLALLSLSAERRKEESGLVEGTGNDVWALVDQPSDYLRR